MEDEGYNPLKGLLPGAESYCGRRIVTAILRKVVFLSVAAGVMMLPACVYHVSEDDLLRPRSQPLAEWLEPNLSESVRCQTVELDGGQSVKLRGWLISPPRARYCMIYFYGTGETVLANRRQLCWLARTLDCRVLAMDYRGYGFSGGSTGMAVFLDDALVAYDYLLSRPLCAGKAVFIYGRSLGATFATYVASRRDAAGLILEAPPTSAAEAIPPLRKLLAWPWRWLVYPRPDKALRQTKPQPIDAIRQIKTPLLVIHGTDDRIVPTELGRRLFEQAGSEHKYWLAVQGAGHNNLSLAREEVCGALLQFFREHGDG